MDDTKTSSSRYASPAYLATYLEMEWSDWLLIGQTSADAPQQLLKPPSVPVVQTFYRAVVQFAEPHVSDPPPQLRFCDVGGATGRFVFEWLSRFPKTEEAVLAEPSEVFNQWSKKLLLSGEPTEWIPAVDFVNRCCWCKPERWPPHVGSFSKARVFIECASADSVPRPPGYFNVVTCLNVADRHPKPRKLISELRRLLAPGGLLILASPMDWGERFVEESEWVEDLKELFDSNWQEIGRTEIEYSARITKRRAINYLSQIIATRKLS